jgi:hypothetical protein
MELVTVLPIFIAGFGCGYYIRDRILHKRRAQYLAPKYLAPKSEPRAGSLMAFKTTSMGDVWRALRKQLPMR